MLRNTTQFIARYSRNKAENENKNKNVQTRFVTKKKEGKQNMKKNTYGWSEETSGVIIYYTMFVYNAHLLFKRMYRRHNRRNSI